MKTIKGLFRYDTDHFSSLRDFLIQSNRININMLRLFISLKLFIFPNVIDRFSLKAHKFPINQPTEQILALF